MHDHEISTNLKKFVAVIPQKPRMISHVCSASVPVLSVSSLNAILTYSEQCEEKIIATIGFPTVLNAKPQLQHRISNLVLRLNGGLSLAGPLRQVLFNRFGRLQTALLQMTEPGRQVCCFVPPCLVSCRRDVIHHRLSPCRDAPLVVT